jgi:tetratricopeptide (TPR) repeat protein
LICRSGTDMLRSIKRTTEVIGRRTEDIICWAGGVVGSLLFAFSPANWSQSVIDEVYSLNAFFLVVILFVAYVWLRAPDEGLPFLTGFMGILGLVSLVIISALTVRECIVYNDFWDTAIHYVLGVLGLWALSGVLIYAWKKNPKDRMLYLMSFVFGLGLTNYQVLLLLVVALVLLVMLKDLTLFRDFVIVLTPYAVVYLLATRNILPALEHPASATAYVYILLSFTFLALVYFFLPNGKSVAPAAAFAILGVAVYVFMPLSSETNPPINWGYPRTWEGFQHAISRGQYEKISPTSIFSMQFVHQVGDYLRDLRGTFTLPVALLGFLPFTAWNIHVSGRRLRVLWAAVGMAALAVALIVVEEVMAPTLGEIAFLSVSYRFLIAGIMILAVMGGTIIVGLEIREIFCRMILRRLPAVSEHPLVDTDIDANSRKWTMVTFLSFLVMSVVLIALASPKGDIQDEFIQRVKFISSHCLYAFWIGYGLVFGLAFVDTIFKGNRFITWFGLTGTLLLPFLPILTNAYNKELIRTSGGAEMTRHDFGWQFGNYQLRGAEAIEEELAADEEPIPNPFFPGEMGPDAIFFGGTDPGRFVPTYMIYCADVRPDVFLITQNALADNTYMSVMRDLYGNQIWIPAQEDSAKAFQRYVEEVKSGRRPPNAELTIENGRVQVSGALGVMEINGILAQMIFEYNNYKHDFYVEESYVIPWMYPYLEPHGLIMKINRSPSVLAEESVRNDQDFWDWYTRRLSSNPLFLRDVVARKSFSKLRSAIAGLYARRGLFRDAENAFRQSRILYSLSPEANFRLAQEVLMQMNRFDEAVELMRDFGRQDPGNDRVQDFINQIERIKDVSKKITALEAQRSQGKMDVNTALDLSEAYLQVQRMGDFMAMMNSLMTATNLPAPIFYRAASMLRSARQLPEMVRAVDLCMQNMPSNSPPEVFLNLSRMYAEAGRADRMLGPLQEFLKRQPNDWKAWLDLAYIQLTVGQTNNAAQSLSQARNRGGQEAMQIIQQDDRFAPLRPRLGMPQRSLLGIPGITGPAT